MLSSRPQKLLETHGELGFQGETPETCSSSSGKWNFSSAFRGGHDAPSREGVRRVPLLAGELHGAHVASRQGWGVLADVRQVFTPPRESDPSGSIYLFFFGWEAQGLPLKNQNGGKRRTLFLDKYHVHVCYHILCKSDNSSFGFFVLHETNILCPLASCAK